MNIFFLNFSLSDGPVSSSEKMYSGLYEYHIPSNTWTKRRDDVGQAPTSSVSGQATSGFRHELKSRSSHSMLFHRELRKLYIFGGQRKGSEYLNDFFRYYECQGHIFLILSILQGDSSKMGQTLR